MLYCFDYVIVLSNRNIIAGTLKSNNELDLENQRIILKSFDNSNCSDLISIICGAIYILPLLDDIKEIKTPDEVML